MLRVAFVLSGITVAASSSCGGSDGGATLVAFGTGTGSGVITSSPPGIDCGSDCAEAFAPGTIVTLTATPDTGSTFGGWDGGCSGTGTCTVTVDIDLGVAASFTLQSYLLTVTAAGTGTGVVTSAPPGIDCGSDCTESFGHGASVVLTATADASSTFAGWDGGGCTGTGPCTTTITAATTITPTFTLNQYDLTVTRAGAGTGTVTSVPAGIDCGTDCTEPFDHGTVVELSAVAAAGSTLAGWSGGGCVGPGVCTTTVTAATDVTATFELMPYNGSIAVLEQAILNPGTSGTFFGQGVVASIAFTDSAAAPGPVMEEQPGSPLGCKVWSYTPAQALAAKIGGDEGPVQITASAGTPYPACTYSAGAGYQCPHANTFSTGGTIAAGPQPGTATLTDTDVTFNASNTTNRYVLITGATNAANNGSFPILALAGANTIVYGNPAVVAETLPGTGSHVNLAAAGVTPTAPDPGFLANDTTMDFTHMLGGGNHIPAFTATTAPGSVGDDFALATSELNRLNAIPRDGSQFTLTCAAADCPAGSATGTILEIVTTDASTAGLSPFAMPAPTTLQRQIRCTVLGAAAVTVPAAYSAYIMSAGATRIRATFIRPTLMAGGPAEVTSIAGHAITGFSN